MDCCSCFGLFRRQHSSSSEENNSSAPTLGKRQSQEHLLGCPVEQLDLDHHSSSLPNGGSTINPHQGLHSKQPFQELKNSPSLVAHDLEITKPSVKQTYRAIRSEDSDGSKMINEYVRVSKIGTGSYGKVVLHRSKRDGKLYAIKIFHKSRLRKIRVAPSETAMTDVLREVFILSQVDHPNIVKLVEVIDDSEGDRFYMVLEYVEGRGIFEGSGPPGGIGEATARRYFRDIVSGLLYLHNHNIIHGDIKPENLLINHEGHIKIGDFGVSRIVEENNDEIRRSPGTPVFTAPECCQGVTYQGKAADIWALGVTLYCMVLGRYPFIGETLQGTYDKIVNSPLYIPEDVNYDLRNLLEGLLCKDPKKRITLNSVACHPWVLKGHGRLQQVVSKRL